MPPPVRRTLDGQLADILTRLGILETRPRGGGGGGGGSTAWDDITGKPSAFPPSAHTHPSSQITDFDTAVPEAMPAASDTAAGKVELATDLETQTGLDATRAVTPLGLNSRTATTGRTGLVELSTLAEAIAGTDTTRAVTPEGVKAVVDARVVAASETAQGIVELATVAEATAGTDTSRAVTPAGVKAAIDAKVLPTASDTVAGLVELATSAETIAGTDATRAVTPAALMAALLGLVYPVGSIFMSAVNTNPGTYLGGTWVAWGAGRVPVGVDTSQPEFNGVEKTGGAKTHVLSVAEMPSHMHKNHAWNIIVAQGGNSGRFGFPAGNFARPMIEDSDQNRYDEASGGGQAHNNLQPYITCYMFKRTA